MTTAFYSDERCFWHGGGNYAFTLPVGGLVQPLAGGLPENPETKRRLKNLLDASGLSDRLIPIRPRMAEEEELLRRYKTAANGSRLLELAGSALQKLDRIWARDDETARELAWPNVRRCPDLAVMKLGKA